MWIVGLALRRPYTFVVMSILILIMGGLAIVRTPTDIFPTIDIPVLSVIGSFNGLVPEDKVRKTVESYREQAQASARDLATVNLSMYADLAVDYFQARSLDAEEQLLELNG